MEETALHAIHTGNIEMLRSVLGAEYNGNANQATDLDSLLNAALLVYDNYNIDMIKLLLECGADVNHMNILFDPPLLTAVHRNDTQLLKLLIQHGADPNVGIESANTSVLFACIRDNNLACLGDLLNAGADVNTMTDALSASFVALKTHTPLHFAVDSNASELSKFLICHGALVNAIDGDGETPICRSVRLENLELTSDLLSFGADTNISDMLGYMPLHCATFHRTDDVVNVLLEGGALVNATDRDGRTPLHLSVETAIVANCSVRKRLVQHGSIMNYTSFQESLEGFVRSTPPTCNSSCTCLKLIVSAGFSLSGVEWIKKFVKNTEASREPNTCSKTVKHFLSHRLENPLSLFSISRITVRAYLISFAQGKSIFPQIDILELPSVIKCYLKMEDE